MSRLDQSGSAVRLLATIVGHPLRVHCIALLTERTASPKELASELGVELTNLSYHVRALHQMGAIELVGERPVRGATEHFYRAIERPYLDDEDYKAMTPAERIDFARGVTQLGIADLQRSIDSGALGERYDHHVSRFPLQVDEEGWAELRDTYSEALDKTYDIEARCAERMNLRARKKKSEARQFVSAEAVGIPVRVLVNVIEMPREVKAVST
jgi:DNA-binding transcriptional ArsR family regulator